MNTAHCKLAAAIVCAIAAYAPTAAPQHASPDRITSTTWRVTDCTDTAGSTASLRYFATSSTTHSGDTISLSECLPGTITLRNGQIRVEANDLEIIGIPGLVVSAANSSRVLDHVGAGSLVLSDIALADGHYVGGTAFGGCIRSNGSVTLRRVAVSNCNATALSDEAKGGAVFAAAGVGMVSSVVSGSEVSGKNLANGGGIYSHGLIALLSTISGNSAHSESGGAHGGGAYIAASPSQISYSTIDHNEADYSGGGLQILSAVSKIWNSTISYNQSGYFGGGISAVTPSLVISNSTIVRNQCDHEGGGGIFLNLYNLTLESSIVSLNTADGGNAADILIGAGALSGADNQITALQMTTPPAGLIVVSAPPVLAPLSNNGGSTRTHMLLPHSPGLGLGNDVGSFISDQRGVGYKRSAGGRVDIGAVQFDTIFVSDQELQ